MVDHGGGGKGKKEGDRPPPVSSEIGNRHKPKRMRGKERISVGGHREKRLHDPCTTITNLGPQIFADELDSLQVIPIHPAPLACPLHKAVPYFIPHVLDSSLHELRLLRL